MTIFNYTADPCPICGVKYGEKHHYPHDLSTMRSSAVDHPAHYGGADDPYEAIKVIEAWGLGFCLGNAVKYICRAGKKKGYLEDLEKALWYLNREIEFLTKEAEKHAKSDTNS